MMHTVVKYIIISNLYMMDTSNQYTFFSDTSIYQRFMLFLISYNLQLYIYLYHNGVLFYITIGNIKVTLA